MNISIILAHEDSPYAGVIRPFINWGKELSKNAEIEFLLLDIGKRLRDVISKLNSKTYTFKNTKELVSFCNKRNYEYIITDDYIKRLDILKHINTSCKKIVYVQVLHGLHSILNIYEPVLFYHKIVYSIIKYVPFTIIKYRYVQLLKNIDYIISNSQFTSSLLYLLYNRMSDAVVYPPVDDEIFVQRMSKKDKVLLYLGSHVGDVDKIFVEEIIKVLQRKGVEVMIMGNDVLRKRLKSKFFVKEVYDVSDKELAKIYSESKLTICPQTWEQFGYVAAESILCGTPVLAFNYLGISEIIRLTRFGFLADNKERFLHILKTIDDIDIKSIDKNNIPFTKLKSTQNLINAIRM